jgi:hypothetical protein
LTAIEASIERLSRVDRAPTAASALLALGAVIAVFIARPWEHGLTSRILRGLRAGLLVSAASATLVVAALLTVEPPSPGCSRRCPPALGAFDDVAPFALIGAWGVVLVMTGTTISWVVSRSRSEAAQRSAR